MITKNITIINKLGLHARAAAKFVTIASKYESSIDIQCKKNKVNGKSIMGVMMLAASKGIEVELIIDGTDEQHAIEALTELINNRFDEKE
ncbi:Phosphotransferase system, phosphocarrier protein HPr [hydrothermal vent metagenome]|uniref:Phosphotransferase system, phosphocarrier protein HPr n=1 Tax=hydrothermal vent metagenome TaxID=652676 RepID=A0A3B1B2N5_9ZZZZ